MASSLEYLTDGSGELITQVSEALEEIFSRYDKDHDGAITMEEFQQFATVSNGAPIPDSEINDLKDHFGLDDNGNLTLQGFLDFYQIQSISDEEETWKDLQSHGYDRHLHLISTKET